MSLFDFLFILLFTLLLLLLLILLLLLLIPLLILLLILPSSVYFSTISAYFSFCSFSRLFALYQFLSPSPSLPPPFLLRRQSNGIPAALTHGRQINCTRKQIHPRASLPLQLRQVCITAPEFFLLIRRRKKKENKNVEWTPVYQVRMNSQHEQPFARDGAAQTHSQTGKAVILLPH